MDERQASKSARVDQSNSDDGGLYNQIRLFWSGESIIISFLVSEVIKYIVIRLMKSHDGRIMDVLNT